MGWGGNFFKTKKSDAELRMDARRALGQKYFTDISELIAIASKLIGGFLGALPLGARGATLVGFGMVPRGEVGVVIASLGLAAGVFNDRIYAIIVAMSLLTAMVTPPVLAWLLKSSGRSEAGGLPQAGSESIP